MEAEAAVASGGGVSLGLALRSLIQETVCSRSSGSRSSSDPPVEAPAPSREPAPSAAARRTLGALGDLRVRTERGTGLSPKLLLDPRPGGDEGDPDPDPEDPKGRRRPGEDSDLELEILMGSS
jgi:hypothetical protein